jgi:hypothetical protein
MLAAFALAPFLLIATLAHGLLALVALAPLTEPSWNQPNMLGPAQWHSGPQPHSPGHLSAFCITPFRLDSSGMGHTTRQA